MKKYIKYPYLILCLIIASVIFLSNTKNDKKIYAEDIKNANQSIENIEGIEHQKIVAFGQVGIYSQKEMLEQLNLAIYPEDKVIVFPDPALGLGSRIDILRANQITVTDANKINAYRTWTKTVSEFLDENKIVLGSDDNININLDEKIKNNLEITINRVALEEVKETESIDYEIVTEDDPSMERGTTEVSQEPEYGEKELIYQVKIENGVEILKQLISEKITKEPVDKIILRGTKVTYLGNGTATWYDLIGGMTAASNELPYGTKVLVRNLANGKSVEVTIADHGIQGDAIIDLSEEAFSQIASLGAGRISVALEKP